ncbi:hypothetical protein GVN20_18465 [Runella sp. CRIBMP]|uniref:SMI1/KNR4 family protein n=1 Tax=Runella sp. CRIBMP TaxID=2683261 RepID=UPI00141367DB|nr:SMI1/KNR4 family protein [Runella sp. CRIBMP]NBB21356.1 hypothetical protein [Runella sp. CRIBMP]
MKNVFFETEIPTSEEEIKAFEKRYDITLPEEYKKHLLEYNGGYPERGVMPKRKAGKSYDAFNTMLNYFLAIYDGKHNNLERTFNNVKERIPKGFLPFANDPGGNLFCISCSIEDFGYIYIWDLESEHEGRKVNDRKREDIKFVCKSLKELLDLLE